MAIKFDLKDSEIIRTINGVELTRTALIDNVTASASGALITALNHASVPSIGDPHPDDSTLVCADITCRPVAFEKFRLSIKYVEDKNFKLGIANAHVMITSSVTSVDVHTDKLGDPLVAVHQYPVTLGFTEVRQAYTAEIEQPQINYEYTYITDVNPYAMRNYTGSINSDSFNGHEQKTVLCSAVDIEELSADYWRVRMRFVYTPSTYQFTATIRPWYSTTAVVSGPIDLLTGTATFDVYQESSFSTLGLPSLTPPPLP
jgi:hypothetical protein